MEGFSSRLKRLMAEKEFTQSELAARASLTQGAVSKYANGVQEPKPRELHAISKALGVPMEFWFDEWRTQPAAPPQPVFDWKSRALKAEGKLKKMRAVLDKNDD